MYQIDSTTAVASQPAATAAGTAGFFTDGNPATSTPATILPAEWLNAVMMELSNVVTGAGLTLSKPTYNQVLAAIKRLGQSTIILADTGTANAYAATNATPLTSGTWLDGVVQQVKIAHANTGASTYAPDGLTAIPIYGLGLQPLQGGELALNGTAVLMRATIPGVNSGNPIAVLMECAGGAQQIAPGTQSNHAVNLGQFASSQASSGYQKLPSGLIIQWGTGTAGGAGTTPQTFPIAFPNACFSVVPAFAYGGSGTPGAASIAYGATTKTGFQVGSTTAFSFDWLAIGN